MLGASGSGKSSLMRAGLLPRLRRDPSTWTVIDPVRPIDRPFTELARAIAHSFARFDEQHDWRRIREELHSAGAGPEAVVQRMEALLEELCERQGRRDTTVLLPLDQFEELLADGPLDEGKRFLPVLSNMLQSTRHRLLVLATLRSDFLGAFQEHPALRGLLFEGVPVGPLTEDRLAEVIAGPAKVAGIELEPGLVPAMVSDTETADALPLLAFTLRELWERHGADGLLKVWEYRVELGGLDGSVARTAEAVLRAHVVETAEP